MKKNIFLLSLLFFLFNYSFSQTTISVTVNWTGAQAQGCCSVCGTDYWCINNTGGCGTSAACASRTFTDPVPAGNTVTSVQVTHYTSPCGGGTVPTTLNGTSVGSVAVGTDCSCGGCISYPTGTTTSTCGIAGYVYGGTNTLTLCPAATFCIQSSVISITYNVVNSVAPTSITASVNPTCSGGATTLTRVGGALGLGASWKWYSVSCGGTSAGTGTSITPSPTATTTYFVRAEGTCNTTACASLQIVVKTYSTAPTASASPNPICEEASSTLSVTSGTLGTGASWKWYTDACPPGTAVGTGTPITVAPLATRTYYVRAEGDCNTTTCAPVTVIVTN